MKPTKAINYSKYWIPVFIVFIIHNFGEYIGNMPKWGQTYLGIPEFGVTQFLFGVMVLVLILILLAIAYYYRANKEKTRRLLIVFCVFMIGNTFWHVGTSFIAKSPSPGVFEAVLLGLPVYGYTLYKLLSFEKFLPFKLLRQK